MSDETIIWHGVDMSKWRARATGGKRALLPGSAICRAEAFRFVQDADAPPPARKRLARLEGALGAAAFHRLGLVEAQVRGTMRSFGLQALASDGAVIAEVMDASATDGSFSCHAWLFSELATGAVLATTTSAPGMPLPPWVDARHVDDASTAELVAAHSQRLRDAESAPRRFDDDGARAWLLDQEQRNFDFHVGRGAYVPLTARELAAVTRAEGRTKR